MSKDLLSQERATLGLMGKQIRTVAGRENLVAGIRVQLEWIRHAPHTQSADPAIPSRFAIVVARLDDDAWLVRDAHGDEHRLEAAQLEVASTDVTAGRWRIAGEVPTYELGERLQLTWRYRGLGRAVQPPRDDCWATVIEEEPDIVRARLEDGCEILLHRFGAQADAPNRQDPRWFVVGRSSGT